MKQTTSTRSPILFVLFLFGLIGTALSMIPTPTMATEPLPNDWIPERRELSGIIFTYQRPASWQPDLSWCEDASVDQACILTEFLVGPVVAQLRTEMITPSEVLLANRVAVSGSIPSEYPELALAHVTVFPDQAGNPLLAAITYAPALLKEDSQQQYLTTLMQVLQTLQFEQEQYQDVSETSSDTLTSSDTFLSRATLSQSTATYRIPCSFDLNDPNSSWNKVRYQMNWTNEQLLNDMNQRGRFGHGGTTAAIDFSFGGSVHLIPRTYHICEGNRQIIAGAGGTINRIVSSCTEGNTGCNSGYGNMVEIAHPNGQRSLYAHLTSNIPVTVGQLVSEGYVIGTMGNTGNSTGTHLHFEVRNSQNQRINTWLFQLQSFGIGQGSSRQYLFEQAYQRKGGQSVIGIPVNTAHWWVGSQEPVVIQDFRGGSASDAAIIHNEGTDNPAGTVPAFVLWGGIWQEYIRRGGPDALGPPTSDEFINWQGQPQNNFGKGYIVFANPNTFTSWPTVSSTHWKEEFFNGYYAGKAITGYPTYVRDGGTTNNIVYNWGMDAPDSGRIGVWNDNFVVRFTRSVWLSAGVYRFHTLSDDGVRLNVNGQMLLDDFVAHDDKINEVTFVAPTSGYYPIRLEFLEIGGEARIELTWAQIIGLTTLPEPGNAHTVFLPLLAQ